MSTPEGSWRRMSASTVFEVGSRMSIRRLCARVSNCSRESLSMCGERITQDFARHPLAHPRRSPPRSSGCRIRESAMGGCWGRTTGVYSARKEVRQMNRAEVDGMTLEYEESGSGDPVVFIHGAHMGETYRPLMGEPALKNYRLIGYHRRGYAGSSKPAGAMSISTHAADCLALLRKLDAVPAHVVGHSSGAIIGIQLALDAPDAVRSLTLLEPALLDVPSGGALIEMLGASVPLYESGDRTGAVD